MNAIVPTYCHNFTAALEELSNSHGGHFAIEFQGNNEESTKGAHSDRMLELFGGINTGQTRLVAYAIEKTPQGFRLLMSEQAVKLGTIDHHWNSKREDSKYHVVIACVKI